MRSTCFVMLHNTFYCGHLDLPPLQWCPDKLPWMSILLHRADAFVGLRESFLGYSLHVVLTAVRGLPQHLCWWPSGSSWGPRFLKCILPLSKWGCVQFKVCFTFKTKGQITHRLEKFVPTVFWVFMILRISGLFLLLWPEKESLLAEAQRMSFWKTSWVSGLYVLNSGVERTR